MGLLLQCRYMVPQFADESKTGAQGHGCGNPTRYQSWVDDWAVKQSSTIIQTATTSPYAIEGRCFCVNTIVLVSIKARLSLHARSDIRNSGAQDDSKDHRRPEEEHRRTGELFRLCATIPTRFLTRNTPGGWGA